MKQFILLMLLSSAASTALAGPETLLSCTEGRAPDTRWSPVGAGTVVCHQMVAGAGIDGGLIGRNGEKMAAFKNEMLIAVRPGDEANPHPSNAPVYQPSDWLETGSTGVPGEMWWGRTATRHVFVGQQSHVRLSKALTLVAPSVRPALRDFGIRSMMSLVQKQPMTFKPGDERFKLFPRERANYVQHAATTATFGGGLGGDGNIAPGKVSNARLELVTYPIIKGVLQFDLVIDGQTRQFTIPVRAASERDHLRSTASNDDDAPVCEHNYAAPSHAKSTSGCIIENGAQFKELYRATGAFFGDQASWAAVLFTLRVNSPSRNRIESTSNGVIVLKAQ